jgi:hypothetical protein
MRACISRCEDEDLGRALHDRTGDRRYTLPLGGAAVPAINVFLRLAWQNHNSTKSTKMLKVRPMDVSFAAASGNIVATAYKYIEDDNSEADILAVNGVTDASLYDAGNKVGDSLQWLDTLTPQQLSENTIGNFDEGLADTTYGQLKLYRQVQTDLGNQESLLAQVGTGASFGSLSASGANQDDIEAVQIATLLGNLAVNKAGSVVAAQAYLSTVASGQGPAPVSPQSVLTAYQAENAFRSTHPHGDWAGPQQASVALTILSKDDNSPSINQIVGPQKRLSKTA